MKKVLRVLIWTAIAIAGAVGYTALALERDEPINSGYLLIAAVCTYAIGYRFYSKWITARLLALDDRRATPCEVHEDGRDFVKTNKWIVFGHHFAAISGPGPLVGPVLAAQFGYLPGTLWILIGVVLGGAVHDMVTLVASMRRDGKSLAEMVREELNTLAGGVGVVAILSIMTVLLAVLALVVVKALAESPWGVFTVGATIPIALFMGCYMRFWRIGRVLEVSVIGGALLLLAVWGGKVVYKSPELAQIFSVGPKALAWAIIAYGLAASVLPVWLLLAPRDYLSTFLKLGTIFALAIGVLIVLPSLQMPAVSKFMDGSGLVIPGKIFPFCFITIACGAISGFHALISSGITPKIITRESYARTVGYGAMCLESLVATMAMIAACALEPAVYLSMNVGGSGPDMAAIQQNIRSKIDASGFTVTKWENGRPRKEVVTVSHEKMEALAAEVGEKNLYGRTGGAATLAVGMAQIFSQVTHGRWLDLWYHFAIMFEALFILTTLDAGTRVGRYLLQDVLGRITPALGDIRNFRANLVASLLMVLGWGYFLIMGVNDPDGGVKALWPIFGIANQLLATIALCLGTTIILKMQLNAKSYPAERQNAPASSATIKNPLPGRPILCLVTLIPLLWLLSVTLSAGAAKVFHSDPRIGFWAAAQNHKAALPALQAALQTAQNSGDADAIKTAQKKVRDCEVQIFNNRVDTIVTLIFMSLASVIFLISVREWILLLLKAKPVRLSETTPVWLPETAVAEGRSFRWLGFLAIAIALARELCGEAAFHRAEALNSRACGCAGHSANLVLTGAGLDSCKPGHAPPQASPLDAQKKRGEIFAETVESRYRGVNRCC